MSTPKQRRLADRRFRLLAQAKRTLDVILSHVRNGGSLIDLCETWQVRYSDMIKWIRDDKARSDLYRQACSDRSEWTDEMILSEIRLRCRLDIRRLYHEDGRRKSVHELDPDIARMIEEVKSDGTIKFFGKKEALELLAKNRRLLTEKTEFDVGGKLEDILSKSYDAPEPSPQPDQTS